MQEIIFITGGQRSGKSRFAQSLAEKRSSHPVYLATSRHWDHDFSKRIERHQAERGNFWRTIEEEKRLDLLDLSHKPQKGLPRTLNQSSAASIPSAHKQNSHKQSNHEPPQGETLLLDCITLWLTNIYHDNGYDLDSSLTEAQQIWDAFIKMPHTLIAVSNEIGMGLHAPDPGARRFADLQGWMNQYIAAQADTAYVLLSGIPLKLK